MDFDIAKLLKTAGVIYATDMLILPQLGGPLMEIAKFFIEGFLVVMVNDYCPCDDQLSGTCAPNTNNFSQAIVAGIALWVTDMILRPEIFRGLGTEMFKFIVQAFLVNWVLQVF